VLTIDIETGPDGGGKLRVIACIEDPLLMGKILGPVQRREWAKLQEDLSLQSSNSTLNFSGQPQHTVHTHQPQLVSDAVNSMLSVVRSD